MRTKARYPCEDPQKRRERRMSRYEEGLCCDCGAINEDIEHYVNCCQCRFIRRERERKRVSKVERREDTPERRAYWQSVQRIAREVATWPKWMKGA